MKFSRLTAAILAAGMMITLAGCSGDSAGKGNVTDKLLSSPVSGTSPKGEKMASSVLAVELKDGDKIAEIEIEGYGVIKAKLYEDIAPVGVKNFIDLAEEGYYDGLKIHRVVADFMMQGGSLNGDGTGGNAKTDSAYFDIEIDKSARHYYGALCYANSMLKNTAQFYIVNNHVSQDISKLNVDNINSVVAQFEEIIAQCEPDSAAYQYYSAMCTQYKNLADFVSSATDEVKKAYEEVGGTPSLDGGYTVFGQVYEGYEIIDAISRVEVGANASGEESKPLTDIIIKTVKIGTYSAAEAEAAATEATTTKASETEAQTASETNVQTVEPNEKN